MVEAAKPPPPPEPVSQWPENLTNSVLDASLLGMPFDLRPYLPKGSVHSSDLTKAGDIPPHALHPRAMGPFFCWGCGIASNFALASHPFTELMSIRFLKAACSGPGSAGRERAGETAGSDESSECWTCRWKDFVLQNLLLYTKYRPFGSSRPWHACWCSFLPRLFGVGNNHEEQPLRTEKAWNSFSSELVVP